MKKKRDVRRDSPYKDFKRRNVLIQEIIDEYKPIFFRWLRDNGYYHLYHQSFYLDEDSSQGKKVDCFDDRVRDYSKCHKNSLKLFIIPRLFQISTKFVTLPISDNEYDEYYLCNDKWLEKCTSLFECDEFL